ncbi:jerky protein homolog-like [Osmia bicornis bicornis]|uniref:jerky protein homolog-like n=1 Tax=Osmia bicornis bicornis TaxID=1437191 RepID=UPI001EAEB6C3|nr:jerky protein homolog-like [Osmia bicornis bicornis]
MSSEKVTLNMQQRIQVLEDLKTLPVRIVAAKYRIHPQTVRRIQKKEIYIREFAAKGKTGQKQQRMKKPVYPELEEQLYTWFCERTALGDRISDLLLQEKAVELQQSSATSSRCKVSMSWVSNFKRRHNIRLVSVCGEKASADTNAAESFIQYFQRHIEQEGIDIENVYNMDESGLFWKALPIKTLSTEKM